ncbi:tail fiber assembly protein [Escherichia coli]|uniref:tail fiber assembly protein n=1 Tax=Escherichia coli TaxID=562 RepID=UPI001F14E6F6
MATYFSAKNLAFYNDELRDGYYEQFDAWPDDAVLMNDDEVAEYCGVTSPGGKVLSAKNGRPVWGDIPPPTKDELIQTAENERLRRIDAANDFMNSKQWPGKAAIGRLKGDELAQYNLWLDYLDALDAIKTASAPDIKWPTPPVEQAS